MPRLRGLLLALAIIAIYANHFESEFHFDDSHAIQNNVAIRSISNIPNFFTDARTFSVLPANQSYRPIVSTSLAIDYWLAAGLKPFYFHLSTFIWYLVQLGLMYLLFVRIIDLADPKESNKLLAFFMVAWYGVHPVSAETVNYVIQRGDLYSTLGVVAAFALYLYYPAKRRLGLYLVPIVIGALAKPPSLMFAPMLLLYCLLFEQHVSLCFWQRGYEWRKLLNAARTALPAFVVAIALYAFQARMTSPTFTPGGYSLKQYLITQPFVHLHYLQSFLLPTELSIDADWKLLASPTEPQALIGFAFYLALFSAIIVTSRVALLRPISFGLSWFVLALVPASVTPLAEVMNDHRMFFPFVGLTLAICWSARVLAFLLCERFASIRPLSAAATLLLPAIILPAYSWSTINRNEVWQSEESVWLDATLKSPNNGRALMNYGLTQMSQGKLLRARDFFRRAEQFVPNYYLLQINLGVVEGALGEHKKAEEYFLRAISMARSMSTPYFYYARWLKKQGRIAESLRNIDIAVKNVPEDFNPRYLRLDIAFEQRDWVTLRELGHKMAQLAPQDQKTKEYLERAALSEKQQVLAAENAVKATTTPEALLALSMVYFQSGRFDECIATARKALELRPTYAEAYSNIGAAYASRSKWNEAIQAAEEALKIDPNLQIAKNNLAWARSQLHKEAR